MADEREDNDATKAAEYERARAARIAKNAAFLKSLEMGKTVEEVKAMMPPPTTHFASSAAFVANNFEGREGVVRQLRTRRLGGHAEGSDGLKLGNGRSRGRRVRGEDLDGQKDETDEEESEEDERNKEEEEEEEDEISRKKDEEDEYVPDVDDILDAYEEDGLSDKSDGEDDEEDNEDVEKGRGRKVARKGAHSRRDSQNKQAVISVKSVATEFVDWSSSFAQGSGRMGDVMGAEANEEDDIQRAIAMSLGLLQPSDHSGAPKLCVGAHSSKHQLEEQQQQQHQEEEQQTPKGTSRKRRPAGEMEGSEQERRRSGVAGSGVVGSGVAGSGVAGSGVAGSGVAGSGAAGSGDAGSGGAGSGLAGRGPPESSWKASDHESALSDARVGPARAPGSVKRKKSRLKAVRTISDSKADSLYFLLDDSGRGAITVADVARIAAAHEFSDWTESQISDMVTLFQDDIRGVSMMQFRSILQRCGFLPLTCPD